MARIFTMSFPHTKTHTPNHLRTIFTFPQYSRTQIINPTFYALNKNNNNIVHDKQQIRGLTNIPASPLHIIPNSHHNIRSTCTRFGFPCFSLYTLQRSCSHSLWFSVMSHSNENGLTATQDSIKTVRCVIKGRVQGVFYRNWTIENATQLGLKGWVRNRRDGSVEALFSGKTEVVDDMMQRCRRGPPDAMVTAFQAYPCTEDPGVTFERRPTI